jgi:23S rRNA pseudouridine1911/1915/1917 synthase
VSRLLPVPPTLVGERVDVALAQMLGLSRARARALMAEGAVRIGGDVVAKSHRLGPDEWIDVDVAHGVVASGTDGGSDVVEQIPVLWEDDEVVVIDKPVGVAAHPSPGWRGPTVTGSLAAAGHRLAESGAAEREGVVHRLDVGTTGVMALAKTPGAYSSLKEQFKERTVDKEYHAIVHGLLDPLAGTIDAPIDRHPTKDYKWAVVAGGRPSITHYETLEAWPRASLVEVHLETGRTHQIRVHMAAMRHPCVGDTTYGADPTLADALGLTRQWLHARSLGFDHPVTRERIIVTSEYPMDLQTAVDRLRDGLPS